VRFTGVGAAIIAPAVAAAIAMAGCGRPHATAGTGPVMTLRVMTYNIEAGNGNIGRVADAIGALSPDVVALQEVDVHWSDRSGFVDQAAALGDRLHMEVRFAPIYRLAGVGTAVPREFGVALLSKFPIVSWRNDTITRLSTQDANPSPRPAPGLLDAMLDVHGTAVRVFNTHLDYRADPRVRRQQVTEMLAFIGSATSPTLVFGDLNAPPDAPELGPLLERLHDAWPPANGSGFTYPATAPVKRIDYVLTSRHFGVTSASVGATQASDHRPVIADLVLR
jgi:endonuclease/exonuclease/phosphatase family metal-dependent hydrolase